MATSRSATAIASDIEADINAGALTAGEQLRSVRELAAELGVAPATVGAAYKRLRERGLVIGRGRQGTRVAPAMTSAPVTSTRVRQDLIDAYNGTPDERLLPDLGAALTAAGALPQARYGDPLIAPELAAAADAHFSADSIDTSAMTVTSGSMDAVDRALRAQGFRTGDRIGVEDPGHTPLHHLVRSAGLVPVPIPVDDEGITPSGLATALAGGLSALVVTPRCQNPTGAAFTTGRAAELNELLAEHRSVFLILDDHAGDVAGVDYVPLSPGGDRWTTIRSLGKSFGPDLRIALVAGDQTTIDRIDNEIANGPGWVSYLLQRAAAHLLLDPDASTAVRAAEDAYAARRQLLISELASHGIASSGRSGINVWIPTPVEQTLVDRARSAGFAIRGADAWRIRSGPAVRVTIARLTTAQVTDLATALGTTDSRATSRSI